MQTYIVSFAVLLCLGITLRLIHPISPSPGLDYSYLIISLFLLAGSFLCLLYRVRRLAFIFLVATLAVFFIALPLDNSLNYYFIWVFAVLLGISILLGFLRIKALVPWMLSALFLGYGQTSLKTDISSPTHLYRWATDDWIKQEQSLVYGLIIKEPEIRPPLNRTDLTIQPLVVAHLREPGAQTRITGVIEVLMSLGRDWDNEGEALATLVATRDEISAHPEAEPAEIIKRKFSQGSFKLSDDEVGIVKVALNELGTKDDPEGKNWISLISKGWLLVKVVDTEELAQTYLDISYYTAYGDIVKIKGGLRPPIAQKNPGAFDLQTFRYSTNYFSEMKVTGQGGRGREADTIEIIRPRIGNFFIAWCLSIKYSLLDVIRQTTPSPDSGFLSGIFLGLRRGVPLKVMQDSRAAGTAHVFAVSGLHVTIIAALILLIFNQTPIPKSIWAPIAVLFLAIFTIITGARPSTLRAAIMNSFALLFFTYFGKNIERSLVMAICVAAILILTIVPDGYGGPLILPSASFLMSFSAVLFLGLMSRPVEHYLNTRLNNLYRIVIFIFFFVLIGLYFMNLENPGAILKSKIFWSLLIAIPVSYFLQQIIPFRPRFTAIPSRYLRTFIAAQLAIQCSIIPLSAVMFHTISLAAPFANFIAIPLIGIVLPLGMLTTLIGLIPIIGIPVALLLTAGNWLGMHFFIIMDDFFARYFPYPQVPKPGPAVLIIFYALVGIFIMREKIILNLRIAFLRLKNSLGDRAARLRLGAVLLTLLVGVVTLSLGFAQVKKPLLKITFIDLSWPAEGMSTLIETPTGDNILIDGGFEGIWGSYQKRYVDHFTGMSGIQEVLLTKKITTFKTVVNTNFDQKLLGGLNTLVGSPDFHIDKIYSCLPPSEFGPQDISINRFAQALTTRGKARARELYKLLLLNLWVDPSAIGEWQQFHQYYRAVEPAELKAFLGTIESKARTDAEAAIGELEEKEAQKKQELLESIISTYEKVRSPISREKAEELAAKWEMPLLPVEEYLKFILELPQPVQWFIYQKAGLVKSPEEIEIYRVALYDKFEKASREAGEIYRGEERFLQYHRLLFFAKDKNIPINESHAGISIIKPTEVDGRKFEVTILSPPAARFDRVKRTTDANSTVIRIAYGDFSLLLTSLMTNSPAERLLGLKGGIKSTVYQVPNFGRGGFYVDSALMLDAVQPEAAIFHYKKSRRIDEYFQKVWDLCQERGIPRYNTTELGAVIITADGENYTIETMIEGEGEEPAEDAEAVSKIEEVGVGF